MYLIAKTEKQKQILALVALKRQVRVLACPISQQDRETGREDCDMTTPHRDGSLACPLAIKNKINKNSEKWSDLPPGSQAY